MRHYLGRIGYTPKDLDQLSFIHVAGTKGKGRYVVSVCTLQRDTILMDHSSVYSTCAFAASILSQFKINGHKLKTGLYTSPHLLEVRERIRIDGEPISKDKFAKYFFNVWDRLESTKVFLLIVAPLADILCSRASMKRFQSLHISDT